MKYSCRHILATYFSLLSVLTLVIFAPSAHDGSNVQLLSLRSSIGVPSVLATMLDYHSDTLQERVAGRLQKRLYSQGKQSPPLDKLAQAITQRQSLLSHKVRADIRSSNGDQHKVWDVSLHAYPLWIHPEFSLTDAVYTVDTSEIAKTIEAEIEPSIQAPVDVEVTGITLQKNITRVSTSGVAKKGQAIDIASASSDLKKALVEDVSGIEIQLLEKNGQLRNVSEIDLGKLELLASGKSDFTGSTYARAYNVRKALNEHVNNMYVAPGETFSFNSTLGGPVSERRGWKMAKVIFGGTELRPAPGGGICQASTTVYRAAVLAGFPVLERRSHSLYVSYYKKYGVGIDATIFPGVQDLTFVNDTGYPVIIQAYNDGNEAYVNVYGTSDGRTVDLQGPYFSSNYPDSLFIDGRRVARNEVAWTQTVQYPNGRTEESIIVSRYHELPSYVRTEFALAE
ncbi:hypothetical protein COU78_06815 [Candidatus Peregrinibacteria bacterium CG10_big_fil_rev_8_21_14_0_10_49_24]|nr:MAG: hypothetical protein COV83_02105 [Candidatus Peregrinibacteria bacterium CG11_big_fil_rev_8_21_14_0_20_49_14]PIR50401.1 MAG: hypothetical protein COU78_06815 [Candidatus Peregrinibacteria bacterium CG10_big_fil_rev_8_21_14_0_10_49_24]PJA67490.1 MAG: hypothetical protein CO157_03605 [Candidatus Peregrinibacteria bacterium CG_4_9_14_3_um_filter_49_12]